MGEGQPEVDYSPCTSSFAREGHRGTREFQVGLHDFSQWRSTLRHTTTFWATFWVPAVLLTACVNQVDFGDDSGRWSKDGECDDPRFSGEGMGVPTDDHVRRDASDCKAMFDDGLIALAENVSPAPTGTRSSTLNSSVEGSDPPSLQEASPSDDPDERTYRICMGLHRDYQSASAATSAAMDRFQMTGDTRYYDEFERLSPRSEALFELYFECRNEYAMLGGRRSLPEPML